jgi:putative membrane protein
MWWDDGGWGAGGWLVMSLMMVVLWGGLIALLVWLVQSISSGTDSRQTGPPPGTADEVLAARFARGEIDEDEFRRRHDALHPRQ